MRVIRDLPAKLGPISSLSFQLEVDAMTSQSWHSLALGLCQVTSRSHHHRVELEIEQAYFVRADEPHVTTTATRRLRGSKQPLDHLS